MEYNEVIRKKNKILCIVLFASIVLRCVVNGIFTGFASVLPLMILGIVLTGVVSLLCWVTKHPQVMMYGMVIILSALAILCMIFFPCTTNFLMFFLAVFMIVIYEDIKPIVLQCVISMICMVIFYNKYSEQLATTWTKDALAMCIVYILSGGFVFVALCSLSKKSFRTLQTTYHESISSKTKTEGLLSEIKKSVHVLGDSSKQISDTIQNAQEISSQISIASEEVSRMSLDEVSSTEAIRDEVEDGVDKIQDVLLACRDMTTVSNETNDTVANSTQSVQILVHEMQLLNVQMQNTVAQMKRLQENNEQIAGILGTLDNITHQTNLLSLNASIEAARAGEQGKGFAVVATEIRNLSDTSQQFTEQIHHILDGINEITIDLQSTISSGQDSVNQCVSHANEVDGAFQSILGNTAAVLNQAKSIEDRAAIVEELFEKMQKDVNDITSNIEQTSASMEEVTASITNLDDSIADVVIGYKDIDSITQELISASNQ